MNPINGVNSEGIFISWINLISYLVLLSLQVMDIAKLMKAYISMIVKKRYSNSQSVSSHSSQCSAW